MADCRCGCTHMRCVCSKSQLTLALYIPALPTNFKCLVWCYAGTVKVSYEPARSSTYSDDLRWRMVYQRMALGLTFDQISKILRVDKTTAQRTVTLFKTTGSIHKQPYPKEKASRKLTPPAQMYILHPTLQKPGIHLHEIQKELEVSLLVKVSLSTLCTFLHKYSSKAENRCFTTR